MKVPQYARYGYCYTKSCEFLEEFKIKAFPINVLEIVHQQKWGLVPYSEFMNEFHCDRQTVIRILGSSDGYTIWDGTNYSIAYNDDPKLGDRIRFTIMHEIGHIYLSHLLDFEATKIYRGSLTKSENRVLENEANAFARNVLSPVSMYLTLKNKSVLNVAHTFGISTAAAEARIDFINQDVKLIHHLKLSDKIMLVYQRFIKKRKCIICDAQFFQKYNYCPICGSKNSLHWGDGKMIYPKLETYEDGKLKECPVCQNEETDMDGEYCIICGIPLVNLCSNEDCSHQPLPSNARYCPICGDKTTFYRRGILKAWDYDENDLPIENGFMNIPNDIDGSIHIPDTDEELPFN